MTRHLIGFLPEQFFSLSGCAVLTSFILVGCTSSRSSTDLDILDQKYIHKYGVEVPLEDWANRGENGKIIVSLKNGVVVSKNYCSGLQEGETTYSFPHCDAVECVETYCGGKLERKVLNYFCGNPKEEIQYLPHGKRVISWYDNGAPKGVEEYEGKRITSAEYYSASGDVESQIKNGMGLRINRDEYGELVSTETYDDGEAVQRVLYYPNGSPKEITPFVKGIVEGQRKTFLPAGEPSTVETWVGGAQHGLTLVFQNGEKYAEVPFEKGAKKGVEKRYRNGTTIVEEISWHDNMRHGPSYTYIGETVKTDYYFQGKEVSKMQYENFTSPIMSRP